MKEPTLPTEFAQQIEAVVAHALDGAPEPDELHNLGAWIEANHWDSLFDNSEFCITVDCVSQLFDDYELREWLGLDDQNRVTDEMRYECAKEMIATKLEAGDAGLMLVAYPLVDSRGRPALLGGIISGPGGQIGCELEWLGAFRDWKAFLDNAAGKSFWFGDKLDNPEKAEVLAAWRRDKDSR